MSDWWIVKCRCGHSVAAHRHYRSGSDCAQCICARFRMNYRDMWTAVHFLIMTSRVTAWTRRWLCRLTTCLIWQHRAKFDTYPYCMRCGKRVDRDHSG